MDYGFCPRCGARRPDAFRWCRKCGLDFQNPPKPEAEATAPPLLVPPPPQRVDVRPVGDRKAMAEWSRDAFTVRCLGALGGVIGIVVGFFLSSIIGGWLHMGVASLLLGLFVGVPLGFFFGVRLAYGLMAH